MIGIGLASEVSTDRIAGGRADEDVSIDRIKCCYPLGYQSREERGPIFFLLRVLWTNCWGSSMSQKPRLALASMCNSKIYWSLCMVIKLIILLDFNSYFAALCHTCVGSHKSAISRPEKRKSSLRVNIQRN